MLPIHAFDKDSCNWAYISEPSGQKSPALQPSHSGGGERQQTREISKLLDSDKEKMWDIDKGVNGMLGAHILEWDGQLGLTEKGLLNPHNSPLTREGTQDLLHI